MTNDANNYSSIEDINQEGQHLAAIHQVLTAAGLTLLSLAPEVATHCDIEQAKAITAFLGETLKPVIENLDGQIDLLALAHKAATDEAAALEELLKAE